MGRRRKKENLIEALVVLSWRAHTRHDIAPAKGIAWQR